ncbi:MAG: hypothetical protein U0R70_10505 [Solirubrobacteraceae bacterium]
MRFPEFLRTTVLLSAAAATVLAVVAVASAAFNDRLPVVWVGAGWWVAAAVIGSVIGRRPETSPAISGLLAGARSSPALPELQPARVLLNRLWPLIVFTVGAGALAFLVPQVPSIACGFAIIWALAWRRQAPAVSAIEDRDGVRFYVEKTSPVRAIELLRTPGFRAARPSPNGSGSLDKSAGRPA